MFKNLLFVLLFLSACSQKQEGNATVAEQQKKIDSLLQAQIKDMEAEHATLLQDRLAIELKLRIDSITQAQLHNRALQKETAQRLSDTAKQPNTDTLNHP